MKKTLVLSLLLSLFFGISAQETLIYTNEDVNFNEGKELFAQRKYAASCRFFEEFLKDAEKTKAGQIQEAEYYLAANAYELGRSDARELLKNHLVKYPHTPFFDKTNLMIGMTWFERKRYKEALEYFNKVNENHLEKRERATLIFNKGYANIEIQDYKQAVSIFGALKGMNTRYDLSASYYYAYANYVLKNYKVALPEFLKIEKNPQYKAIVPYYIVQIYYAQQEFDKLNERAEALLEEDPSNPNNVEIYRIMGEISYGKKEYKKTIAYMKNYEKISPVLRKDMYILGLSYYQVGEYANAIKYLSKATTEADEMTENAYLHIGNANIKLDDKTNARLAYEAALKTKFNKTVREEALYNYALTTYETTSAFGESISAFEQLLTEFPNSKFTDKAYDYLASVYMTSKNYEAAYESIQKVKKPTAKLLEAKQYLLYQIGTEAFAQNNYDKAIQYFTLSLQSSSVGKYSSESYFWRSESFFRKNEPDKSIADLKSFFSSALARSSVNYKAANYSMAYAYFAQKNYNEALSWFLKYVELEDNTKATTYPDATNRIGDCYFNARDFENADAYYIKAAAISPNAADYATFQSAYVAGLQKNYNTKIERLETLISKYPKSAYKDDALYEIGRAYLMLENDAQAIATFEKLLNSQPKSNQARKAALEIGMIYFNQNNLDEAIKAYKNVIAKYPGSEESYTALESLESVYIEKNDVTEYLAYTKTLGMKISSDAAGREDSISYIAAEKQYMIGSYEQAIKGLSAYLSNYCPNGHYCTMAQFYLADSYYRTKDTDNALTAYRAVLLINGNPYIQEATTRCAEITYDKKDYQASLEYFKQLQTFAQNAKDRDIARLGVLRCSYFLNDHETTINIANEIIADSKSGIEMESEALYNRAKAYIAMNKSQEAIADLKSLAEDTRTANGAESKYLLANIYFTQDKSSDAEKEVLDFAKKNTPYQFWLAKSFILLADIYIQRGNDFQAKQYLLSLQKNYTTADEIQTLITERLNAITQRENETIIN